MRIRLFPVGLLALAALPACAPKPEAQAAEQVRAGLSLARAAQPEPAAHAFELATRHVPGHYEAWMRLARVRLDQQSFEKARAAAARFVALRASSAYAHELAGRAALGLGDEPAAVRELARALELDPGRRYLHVTLGRIHERAARYPDALAAYTVAIDALPGSAEPRIGKARVLLGHPPASRYAIRAPSGEATTARGPSAAVRDEASRLLDDARAAKAVTDAQRAEIVRLSAYIERVRAEERRRELLVADTSSARARALSQARVIGILGMLNTHGSGSFVASPWGRDTALGNDPMSALGALQGDRIGDSFGFGGLGLRGSGLGGGGTGEGTIGLGNLGTIGRGGGGGSAVGFGSGAGGLGGLRSTRSTATAQVGAPTVRGSIPSEVVARIVTRHTNVLRYCYEQGLSRNPALAGRVVVRLTVAPEGTTSSAVVSSSTLSDPAVEACITRTTQRMVFPASPGIAIVDFSVVFAH